MGFGPIDIDQLNYFPSICHLTLKLLVYLVKLLFSQVSAGYMRHLIFQKQKPIYKMFGDEYEICFTSPI